MQLLMMYRNRQLQAFRFKSMSPLWYLVSRICGFNLAMASGARFSQLLIAEKSNRVQPGWRLHKRDAW
jgi:hypothetical protein